MTGTAHPTPPTTTRTRRQRSRGAGVVEYALLVALIALVCVASLRVFGVTNGGSVNTTADSYASAVN